MPRSSCPARHHGCLVTRWVTSRVSKKSTAGRTFTILVEYRPTFTPPPRYGLGGADWVFNPGPSPGNG
eukprot:scaffold1496_cov36-Phaeocystis_antarctica.AAC.1